MIYRDNLAFHILPMCLVIYKWNVIANDWETKDMMPIHRAREKYPDLFVHVEAQKNENTGLENVLQNLQIGAS